MHIFVIILNFNGKTDTTECVHSILTSSYPNYTIILVDNNSKDGSPEHLKTAFPHIQLIETGANLGYAGGNNVGIRYALKQEADAILILNNDTILHPNTLEDFVKESHNHPNTALGGRVYYHDTPAEMQHFCGVWDKKKGKFRNLPDATFDPETPREVDFITGCALFIPKTLLEKVGLFEESFFLYYEEIDWCARAKQAGFKLKYVPTPMLWHKESKSFATPRPPQSYFQWRNRLLFMERNLPKSEYRRWILTKLPRRLLMLILKRCLHSFTGNSISKASYRASLLGIAHYWQGRFGNGPAWIFKKPS